MRNRPSTAAEIHASRVQAARNRIHPLLRRRVVTYRRELERQVCEVGVNFYTTPEWERPEPHHFEEAIKGLVREKEVGEENVDFGNTPYRFWYLTRTPDRTVQAVMARKQAAVEVFEKVEHTPEWSGWHAEEVHHKALLDSHLWLSVGWRPGHKITTLGARRLDKEKPSDIDLAGHHQQTGIPFVAQIKNGREWLYPPDHEIWKLMGTAAQLDAFPILIARRLPDRIFLLMKLVGGFALRAVKMIFPPELETAAPIPDGPSLAAALRELSFHTDVDFIAEPLPRHKAFWTGPLNEEIAAAHERFMEVRDRVIEIAYDERLARPGRQRDQDRRRAIVIQLFRDIRARDRAALLAQQAESAPVDEIPF